MRKRKIGAMTNRIVHGSTRMVAARLGHVRPGRVPTIVVTHRSGDGQIIGFAIAVQRNHRDFRRGHAIPLGWNEVGMPGERHRQLLGTFLRRETAVALRDALDEALSSTEPLVREPNLLDWLDEQERLGLIKPRNHEQAMLDLLRRQPQTGNIEEDNTA